MDASIILFNYYFYVSVFVMKYSQGIEAGNSYSVAMLIEK